MNFGMQVFASLNYRSVDITWVDRSSDGKLRAIPPVAEPVAFDEGSNPLPTMRLTREAAQMLMDELWNCNIRPEGAAGSVGQLGAVEKHLQDMRAIAFAKLEIGKP